MKWVNQKNSVYESRLCFFKCIKDILGITEEIEYGINSIWCCGIISFLSCKNGIVILKQIIKPKSGLENPWQAKKKRKRTYTLPYTHQKRLNHIVLNVKGNI